MLTLFTASTQMFNSLLPSRAAVLGRRVLFLLDTLEQPFLRILQQNAVAGLGALFGLALLLSTYCWQSSIVRHLRVRIGSSASTSKIPAAATPLHSCSICRDIPRERLHSVFHARPLPIRLYLDAAVDKVMKLVLSALFSTILAVVSAFGQSPSKVLRSGLEKALGGSEGPKSNRVQSFVPER